MAFSSGLAAGLQAGANIGFGIQDRKRRAQLDQQELDRQATLDKRYNKAQEATATQRGITNELAQDRLDNTINQQAVTNYRADQADQRSATTFEHQNTDRQNKHEKQKARDFLTLSQSDGGVSGALNSTPIGKEFMKNSGVSSVELQPATDGAGFWVIGTGKSGSHLMDVNGQFVHSEKQGDFRPLTSAGIATFGAHILGISPQNMGAALADQSRALIATKKAMADENLKQKHALELARMKLRNKSKTYKSISNTLSKKIDNVIANNLSGEAQDEATLAVYAAISKTARENNIGNEEAAGIVLRRFRDSVNEVDYGHNTFNAKKFTGGADPRPAKINSPDAIANNVAKLLAGDAAKPNVAPKAVKASKPTTSPRGLAKPATTAKPAAKTGFFNRNYKQAGQITPKPVMDSNHPFQYIGDSLMNAITVKAK